MQIISWTESRPKLDFSRKINVQRTLIDTITRRRWQLIGHMLRNGNKLHSLKIEEMVEVSLQDAQEYGK